MHKEKQFRKKSRKYYLIHFRLLLLSPTKIRMASLIYHACLRFITTCLRVPDQLDNAFNALNDLIIHVLRTDTNKTNSFIFNKKKRFVSRSKGLKHEEVNFVMTFVILLLRHILVTRYMDAHLIEFSILNIIYAFSFCLTLVFVTLVLFRNEPRIIDV